jgi:hypothetical protein
MLLAALLFLIEPQLLARPASFRVRRAPGSLSARGGQSAVLTDGLARLPLRSRHGVLFRQALRCLPLHGAELTP